MTDRQLGSARKRIDHLIVLMLENRSFDHMFGYLNHPSPVYERLEEGDRRFPNPDDNTDPAGTAQARAVHHPTSTGRKVMPFDPHHSHAETLRQLGIRPPAAPNSGFVASYRDKAGGASRDDYDVGSLVMACQPEGNLPGLATLAKEFALCTRWFSSVPGETWPNRNFVHAATSDGSVDNEFGVYLDATIFEVLDTWADGIHNRPAWRIYHDGPTHVMAFRRLWGNVRTWRRWDSLDELFGDIDADRLAAYSFVEPNQNTPIASRFDPFSSSQHPGNNRVGVTDYLTAPAGAGADFERGDRLIAQIYEALLRNPGVFERTMLVITYDEHGGLWDRVHPPAAVPPGDEHNPSLLRSLLKPFIRRTRGVDSPPFDFGRYGARVPAVVVSPWIAHGRIDDRERDHAAVPHTLRDLFAPRAQELSKRDAASAAFWDLVLDRAEPRRGADLPDLGAEAAAPVIAGPEEDILPQPAELDAYSQALMALGRYVGDELAGRPIRTADEYMLPITTDDVEPEALLDDVRTAMDRFAELEHTEVS